MPAQDKRDGAQDLQAPRPSNTTRLSALSIDEEYFAQPQLPTSPHSPRPASTDLPAALALPRSRTRSSTSPATPSSLRAAPSVVLDDETASIHSFVPTITAGDDLEAMLSEMLGGDSRWQIDDNDELDIWEGQSEGESDTDFESDSEPDEDDGTTPVKSVDVDGVVEDRMIRWRGRRKHFFILSAAGKPIYSRYGDDGIISGYMGVIQTIISFFEDNGDMLRYQNSSLQTFDRLGVLQLQRIDLS